MRAPPAPILAHKTTPPPKPTIYLKEADPAVKLAPREQLRVKVRRRFFHTINASRWVEAGGLQFQFSAYDNFGGAWRGVYATESPAEIAVLFSLSRDPTTGIDEITEEQFNAKSSEIKNIAIPAPTKPASINAQWAEDLENLIRNGYEFTKIDDCKKDYPATTGQTKWQSGILGMPITRDLVYYNAGLAVISGKLVCIARRWTRQAPTVWNSHLEAIELNDAMEVQATSGMRMVNQRRFMQYEDPRISIGPNGEAFVAYCSWKSGTRYMAKQAISRLDSQYHAVQEWYPAYGNNPTNAGHEKNWLWFWDDGQWHLVYSFQPHVVVEMGTEFNPRVTHKTILQVVPWAYGQIRGGSSPVKHDGHYYSFFHSSLPWEGKRKRYYMGAYRFQAHPPYAVTHMTTEPLLAGSRHDTHILGGPLVVFPCGLVFKDKMWITTYGVNDEATGWLKVPHEDLMARMVEVGK